MRELWRTAHSRGLDLLLISGTTRQLKLYRQLGFEPFDSRQAGPREPPPVEDLAPVPTIWLR